MYDDYVVITHKLPKELKSINIYGLADWHIGSAEADENLIEKQVQTILKDKAGYCVIAGDLLNNGLKQSKTNTYEEVLNPIAQKERVYELLKPLAEAGKILAVTDGNHEYRSVREVGVSPLYDICCRLQIEHLFRPYQCLMKLCFGLSGFGRAGGQNVYGGLVIHGSGRNKHRKYEMTVEGIDFCVSGHTHQPELASRGKIRLDLIRGTAKQVNFKSLICQPALMHGGYGIQKEYEPTGTGEIQYLTLGTIEADKVKKMEFHTRQI